MAAVNLAIAPLQHILRATTPAAHIPDYQAGSRDSLLLPTHLSPFRRAFTIVPWFDTNTLLVRDCAKPSHRFERWFTGRVLHFSTALTAFANARLWRFSCLPPHLQTLFPTGSTFDKAVNAAASRVCRARTAQHYRCHAPPARAGIPHRVAPLHLPHRHTTFQRPPYHGAGCRFTARCYLPPHLPRHTW